MAGLIFRFFDFRFSIVRSFDAAANVLEVAGLKQIETPGASRQLNISTLSGRRNFLTSIDGRLNAIEASLADLDASLADLDASLANPDASLADNAIEASLADLDASLADLDASLADLDASLADPDASLADPDASLAAIDAKRAEIHVSLAKIDASLAEIDVCLGGGRRIPAIAESTRNQNTHTGGVYHNPQVHTTSAAETSGTTTEQEKKHTLLDVGVWRSPRKNRGSCCGPQWWTHLRLGYLGWLELREETDLMKLRWQTHPSMAKSTRELDTHLVEGGARMEKIETHIASAGGGRTSDWLTSGRLEPIEEFVLKTEHRKPKDRLWHAAPRSLYFGALNRLSTQRLSWTTRCDIPPAGRTPSLKAVNLNDCRSRERC